MTEGITLLNPSGAPIDADRLMGAARAALNGKPEYELSSLSVVLTDSATIRAMNRQYAQVDAATDVLSFRAEALPPESGTRGAYLGDIVIAHDYASDQALATGTAIGDVLCLLAIHGTLHLMGYDHDSPAARESMWAAQDVALRASNIDQAIVNRYGHIEDDPAQNEPNGQDSDA